LVRVASFLCPCITDHWYVASSASSTSSSSSTSRSGSSTSGASASSSSHSSSSGTIHAFGLFYTTLSDGHVSTMTESRSTFLTTLSDGTVSTSFGSYKPVSTSESSSHSSMTESSSPASTSVSTTSGSSTSGTSSIDTSASSTLASLSSIQTSDGGATATSSSPSSTSSAAGGGGSGSAPPTSELAGGIVGGVAGLAALLLVALMFIRWYRRHNAVQEIGSREPEAMQGGSTPRSGPGMAERAGLLPLAGIFRPSGNSREPASGERGFTRISGRKLPSAFSPGMTGNAAGASPGPTRPSILPMPAAFENGSNNSGGQNGSSGYNSRRNASNASFYRDSAYLGDGPNPAESGAQPEYHPGPARQPTLHPGGPYAPSPSYTDPRSPSPPGSPRQNLLQGRAPTPSNVNAGPSPTNLQFLDRSDTPGSYGSRFTEEV